MSLVIPHAAPIAIADARYPFGVHIQWMFENKIMATTVSCNACHMLRNPL